MSPDDLQVHVDLCYGHYNTFVFHQKKKNCAVCSCNIRNNVKYYSCKSEDFQFITDKALLINVAVDELTTSSLLCRSCYQFVFSKGCAMQLDDLLHNLEKKIAALSGYDLDSVREKTLIEICIHLCKVFKDDGVCLLVDLYDKYLAKLEINIGNGYGPTNGESSTPPVGKKKFLSELMSRFNNLLSLHHTTSSKQGTMLFYAKCEWKVVLHKLLYKFNMLNTKSKAFVPH